MTEHKLDHSENLVATLEESKKEILSLRKEIATIRSKLEPENIAKSNLAQAAEIARLNEAVEYRDERIKFLKSTVSWRITEPIRWLGRTEKKTKAILDMIGGFFRQLAIRCWNALWKYFEKKLKARPELLRWVMRQLNRLPGLRTKILSMDPAKRDFETTVQKAKAHPVKTDALPINNADITLHARRIYFHLVSQHNRHRE